MAKLSSTNIYGDLTVDGTIRGTVNGSITGNATTASKLATVRTLTIGNTGKTFDGSGNVSWSLSEIGAAAASHGTHLVLGTGSGNAFRGDYGNTAYNHSQAAHAPSNAQKNSDITKAEIEAKLTGTITSHNHSGTYAPASHNHTSLTGITNLTFAANADDSSIIKITKDGSVSYTDFVMSDDAGSDMWRWRFSAWDSAASATTAEYNLMTLKASSTTKGQLSVNGNVTADSFTEGGTALSSKYAAASHGTHLTIGTGSGNAAAGNHTHSYLPLSGGTMTGKISGGAMTGTWVAAAGGSSFINSTAAAGNFHPMLSAKTTNGGMTLAFYQNALQVGYLTKANIDSSTNTLAKNACLMDESGNGTWPGSVSATSFIENGTALSSKYAAASHGTHLTIGTGASNAAAGNHTHNYAGSSSAGGAATSANKVNNNLVIKLNSGSTEGTNLFTFNGSAAKTINITPSSIGAAASSHGTHVSYGGNGSATTVSRSDHTHSYLPLSGGTVTGATTFNNYLKINAWSGYGTGTADIWYDGTNKTVEIDGVTDLKLGETKVTKGAYTIWTGSQSDYNNISSKSSTTLYFIK